MPLTVADFEGFKPEAAQRYLKSFDPRTRQKGESYFRGGAVESLFCDIPGLAYSAKVLGSDEYEVSVSCSGECGGECSCPVGYHCKHVYATVKQLLAEYTSAIVSDLSSTGARKIVPLPQVMGLGSATAAPATFAETVSRNLGRKLTPDESRYLRSVNTLYRQAVAGQLHYFHQLAGLNLPAGADYWNRLDLYPNRPSSEQEFWNYLALYIEEVLQRQIPPFLTSSTDLTKVRERMRRHLRGREIERWRNTLSNYVPNTNTTEPATAEPGQLRLRFTAEEVIYEWRVGGEEWREIKPRTARQFEDKHAAQLPPDAELLWLPYWQRTVNSYTPSLRYNDSWTEEQIGRWFRQPLLRSLFVDAAGGPLVFHEDSLRWKVAQPEDANGDYSLSLVRANGESVPKVWLATGRRPVFYLTPIGVFTGPPFEPHLISLNNTTVIPAKAFESAGGLRLLERLRVEPPPRLAARIHTVKLRPGVRAEIKAPWAGSATEYCFVEVYGASDDATHVEHWVGGAWMNLKNPLSRSEEKEFLRLDRSALGGLIPPLEAAGFKWDFNFQRWQLRLTKKFAETFVTFLKALPPEARIDLGGELASFQSAEVAGKIRLEAGETEMDWFDLRVVVDVSDTTLTKEEINLLLDAKGKWVRLGKRGWRKLEFALSEEEDRELARLGAHAA